MHRWFVKTTTAAAAVLALAGCCKKDGGNGAPGDPGLDGPGVSNTPSSDDVKEVERDAFGKLPAPADPAVPREKGAGAAYFGTQGGSLVKLEGGSFSKVVGKLGWVKSIATDKDGTLWVASTSKVHRIKNGKSKSWRGQGKARSFHEIALAADGTVWLTGLYGVTRYENNAWKTYLKEQIHPDLKGSIGGIEVDAKGRVWVVGSQLIAVLEGDKWTAVSTKKGATGSLFCKGVELADGALYTLADGGVVKITADGWYTLKSRTRVSGNHLATGPAGTFLAADYKSVLRITKGSPVQHYEQGNAFKGKSIRTLAADGKGRAWFTTEVGLTVLDEKGKVLQWAQGTEPTLVEKVSAIFVEGDGPELPSSVGAVKTGTVRGKLVRGGKAAAGIPVEICASPRMMYSEGETPCTTAGIHKSGKSGPDGTFVFTKVPIGTYGLAYKTGPKWTITMGTTYCKDMKAGGTCRIRAVDVNR